MFSSAARALATLGVAAIVLGAATAPAIAADQLPALDRRDAPAKRTGPPAPQAARDALARELGPGAAVRTALGGGVAFAGGQGTLLTGPSSKTPASITLGYLAAHRDVFGLGKRDVANLRLLAKSTSPDGITHLRYNQVLDGVLAYDHGIIAHVARDGRLISIAGGAVPGATLDAGAPGLSAREALGEARDATDGAAALPPRTSATSTKTRFATGEQAELRWTVGEEGPQLAWQVIADGAGEQSYAVLVGADDGALLVRTPLTGHAGEARHFRHSPDQPAGLAEAAMPAAWYDEHAGGTRLWGQYARTYADPADADPAPGAEGGAALTQIAASGSSGGAPNWLFGRTPVTPFAGVVCAASGCTWSGEGNLTGRATAVTNLAPSATNAHVVVNEVAEYLQQTPIGFDEASGNFQRVNASGAGLGNDYVRVEVNDGEGFNNANMSTPPDGSAPRMQTYLFRSRGVNGADDAGVLMHEYVHGLSNRLVVNASGVSGLSAFQSRGMGEGWSDFYAVDRLVAEGDITDGPSADVTTGAYLFGAGGVRSRPIDCPVDPAGTVAVCNAGLAAPAVINGGLTYGDFAAAGTASPHNIGEIWSQTLWDLRTAVGREAALALITGGMRLSPVTPTFLDMRDAILRQAVAMRSAPGAADDHYTAVWQVFRGRGMGADASTTGAEDATPTEGSAPPSGLRLAAPVVTDPYPGGDADGVIEAGEQVSITADATGIGVADLAGVTGTLTTTDPEAVVASGSAAWPLLGRGRTGRNTTPLSLRLPAQCGTGTPIAISLASAEGAADLTTRIDPRAADRRVRPLTDGPTGVTEVSWVAPDGAPITDVDLEIGELRHTYLGDLTIEVVHAGVTVTLLDRPGFPGGPDGFGWTGDDLVGVVFDSDSAATPVFAGPGPLTGRIPPVVASGLDAFDGLPSGGSWTLRVTDHYEGDTGELRSWQPDGPQVRSCGTLEIPGAETQPAADVAPTAASLVGAVTPNGRATGLRFAYGTTTGYGSVTPTAQLGDGVAALRRTVALTGLAPSTTYHYRVEAIREGGVVAVAGADRTFTTPAQPVVPPADGGGATGDGGGPAGDPAPGAFGPGAGSVLGDVIAPVLQGKIAVKQTKGTRKGARRASFTLQLSEAATVAVTVSRELPGIRKGGQCVKPANGKRGQACKRKVIVAERSAPRGAGTGKLALAKGGLPKGSYKARFTATDAAGNVSAPRTVAFRVR